MGFTLSRDGWLLLASCAVRSFAYGLLSVILGVYLDGVGLSPVTIGWIFTAALAGSAVMTLVIAALADRFGRKRLLVAGAILMALAGWVFAVSDHPLVLALAAIFGTISPSGKDVGPFLSLEQAILPQTVKDQQRTAVFSAYNLVGSFAGALGALAVGLPALLSLPATAGNACCSGATSLRRFCSLCCSLASRRESRSRPNRRHNFVTQGSKNPGAWSQNWRAFLLWTPLPAASSSKASWLTGSTCATAPT